MVPTMLHYVSRPPCFFNDLFKFAALLRRLLEDEIERRMLPAHPSKEQAVQAPALGERSLICTAKGNAQSSFHLGMSCPAVQSFQHEG
jgi:hypothetical protein